MMSGIFILGLGGEYISQNRLNICCFGFMKVAHKCCKYFCYIVVAFSGPGHFSFLFYLCYFVLGFFSFLCFNLNRKWAEGFYFLSGALSGLPPT